MSLSFRTSLVSHPLFVYRSLGLYIPPYISLPLPPLSFPFLPQTKNTHPSPSPAPAPAKAWPSRCHGQGQGQAERDRDLAADMGGCRRRTAPTITLRPLSPTPRVQRRAHLRWARRNTYSTSFSPPPDPRRRRARTGRAIAGENVPSARRGSGTRKGGMGGARGCGRCCCPTRRCHGSSRLRMRIRRGIWRLAGFYLGGRLLELEDALRR
ncbi:hypothetical protein DFH07DRAFT_220339 [Mycena maculata]|uniref:Uncharacterized protein n=1 Tax=Mycena maculata TaxID=230809 RepID=A0AAD7HUR0_9AGAR|nr:hypothetical protein DFH07DRAFT_220339 [Mycena maculata]